MQPTSVDRVSCIKPTPVSSTFNFSCNPVREPGVLKDCLAGLTAVQTGAVVEVVTITMSDITTSADDTIDG